MRIVVLLPEALVGTLALLSAVAGLRRPAGPRRWLETLVLAGLAASLGLELWLGAGSLADLQQGTNTLFHGGFIQDRFALLAKAAFLVATLVVVALTDVRSEGRDRSLSLALTLLVCFAGLLVASATYLVGLWTGLALGLGAGVAVVALHDDRSTEAAAASVGRLVAGGLLLGLLGIGFSLLFAAAGTSELLAPASTASTDPTQFSPMGGALARLPVPLALPMVLTMSLVLASLAGLLAVSLAGGWGGTAAGGAALGRGVAAGLGGGVVLVVLLKVATALSALLPGWGPMFAVLAVAGVLVGGLGALAAQTPRLQVAFLSFGQLAWIGLAMLGEYRMSVGAGLLLFGVWLVAATVLPALLSLLPAQSWRHLAGAGSGHGLGAFRSFGLVLGTLSLAGVPPLGGWLGDFSIMNELGRWGWWWVLAPALLGWVLALASCARLARALYLESDESQALGRPGAGRGAARRSASSKDGWRAWAGALVLIVLLVAFSFFASPIHGLALQGASALGVP